MCGICGFAACDPRQTPLGRERLSLMVQSLTHRGPDESGELIEPGIAMGMRRLSIIDVDGGHQPVCSEDGAIWAIQNGEIYNHPRLIDELSRDHRLVSRCDTEVLPHLYEELGVRFPTRLSGMYAVAVWDRPNRRLTLARDRLGIKPLYVAETDAGLAFASEVKALLAGGLVEPRLDPEAAELFLAYGYVPGPHTLFQGVRKLMPSTVLTWEAGSLQQESYWTPVDGARSDRPATRWEADQEELLEHLRRAVREHMVSDVPLGLMLSGGLDSSLVGALMAEASSRPIKTFSVGFSGLADSNELDDARRVASQLGADHHELLLDPRDDPSALEEILWNIEEPVADLSSLGFQLICQLARRHVTVALSGQGADELLGGYRKHQIAYVADRLSAIPGAPRLSRLGAHAFPENSTAARGLRAISDMPVPEKFLAMSRILQRSQRQSLLSRAFQPDDAEQLIRMPLVLPPQQSGLSNLAQVRLLDLRLALVDQLFLYFDKMSMAHSLEVRVPLVDDRLTSFCFGLADDRSVWRLRRKEILRRVAGGVLDDQTLSKKKVGFFHSALVGWLERHGQGYAASILLDERTRQRGQINQDLLGTMLGENAQRGKKNAQVVFVSLMLELWQRMYVDGGYRSRLGAGSRAAATAARSSELAPQST